MSTTPPEMDLSPEFIAKFNGLIRDAKQSVMHSVCLAACREIDARVAPMFHLFRSELNKHLGGSRQHFTASVNEQSFQASQPQSSGLRESASQSDQPPKATSSFISPVTQPDDQQKGQSIGFQHLTGQVPSPTAQQEIHSEPMPPKALITYLKKEAYRNNSDAGQSVQGQASASDASPVASQQEFSPEPSSVPSQFPTRIQLIARKPIEPRQSIIILQHGVNNSLKQTETKLMSALESATILKSNENDIKLEGQSFAREQPLLDDREQPIEDQKEKFDEQEYKIEHHEEPTKKDEENWHQEQAMEDEPVQSEQDEQYPEDECDCEDCLNSNSDGTGNESDDSVTFIEQVVKKPKLSSPNEPVGVKDDYPLEDANSVESPFGGSGHGSSGGDSTGIASDAPNNSIADPSVDEAIKILHQSNRNHMPKRESRIYKIISLCCSVDTCTEQFANAFELAKHVISVHRIQQFRCLLANCDQSFALSALLRDHVDRDHANEPMHCGQCGNKAKDLQSLSFHNNFYHVKGRFQCILTECTFVGTTRADVRRHCIMTHFRFTCPVTECAKSYSRHYLMVRHMKVHRPVVRRTTGNRLPV